MNPRFANPFNVTKADDFSDSDIEAFFVDMPGGEYLQIANPASATSMLIRGGKGSGKTHIMRYCSYAIQKIRGAPNVTQNVRNEGYVGIYSRCGGLNASRFAGKGQAREVWVALFAYYIELWLSQLVLTTIDDFCGTTEAAGDIERAVEQCLALLDEPIAGECRTLQELAARLHRVQRQLDIDINNVAMTRTLNVRIAATPGRLVFGIPRVLTETLASCNGLLFVYLLDEYENFQEDQQKYFNTLVREKERPTTFKIGGRIYGFRTLKTLSADEEIKEGSEYEVLPLDHNLRENKNYGRFARLLCARRLVQAGYAPDGSKPETLIPVLDAAFGTPVGSELHDIETAFIIDKYAGRERPYFQKLRDRLRTGLRLEAAPGISSDADIEAIITDLRRPVQPLLEKMNIFRFYQLWRASSDLLITAREVSNQCSMFVGGTRSGEFASTLKHYKADLLAQLLRECDQKQRYVGLEVFIAMSEGLPRNLLVILKLIFNWAVFNGEMPFGASGISSASQHAGVKQAADWFFNDARMPGDEGQAIRDGISRLARLFREVRFSDKPAECSLCAFSADLATCSENARRIINLAENWSVLIKVPGGQRDKNSLRVDDKYQLNAMLAPLWDLPVHRRGVLPLNPRDVNAIFDPSALADFEAIISERVSRMTAPLFGMKGRVSSEQKPLPLR